MFYDQSPEPEKITSTNQNFHTETRKSAFPTMPRKNQKVPDKIRQIFTERRPYSLCETTEKY